MLSPKLVADISAANENLMKEFYDFKDQEVIRAIHNGYCEKITELEDLYNSKGAGKPLGYIPLNSLYAWLWQASRDTCKRLIFEKVFISKTIENSNEEKHRIVKKIEDLHGKKDQYPKPYLAIQDMERANINNSTSFAVRHKLLLMLGINFGELVKGNYSEALPIYQQVCGQYAHFTCDQKLEEAKILNLLRDSCRIMGLRLCSHIKQGILEIHNESNV